MQDNLDRYIPVGGDGPAAQPESQAHFMMRALLASRVDVGSESEPWEQDVNIYLTHLLCAYAKAEYHLRVSQYLSAYDTAVFERIRRSTSSRLKYTVYRANADHLLISIGVFQNPTGRRPDVLPAILHTDGEVHVGRGKTYYDFASTYSHGLFGPTSGVATVLGKLSHGFERYVRILTHMRSEYLHFVEQMSDGELYHLQRSVQTEGLRTLHNEFLDLYSEWRRNPTPELHAQLLEMIERLKRLDPAFTFELPH